MINNLDFENLIYFDNAATTRVDRQVLDIMVEYGDKYYANNESAHIFGTYVDCEINKAVKTFAKYLSCDFDEIVWTSGATEGNNFSILQSVEKNKKFGKHILTDRIEHPSVDNVIEKLKNDGYDVEYVNVDNCGQIDLYDLEKKIREDTILASFMFVNNEIGSKRNIEVISKIIKEKNKNVIIHIDAVQGFGKYELKPKKMNIDLLTSSAHKIHGPKGVGVLYINKNLHLQPLLLGGGQQRNMRSGTLNSQGIIGFEKALSLMLDNIDDNRNYLLKLRNYFIERINILNNEIKDISLNTQNNDNFTCNIVSVNIKNVRAEVLLHSLEEDNIFVSAGSACSSKDKKLSNTLKYINLPQDLQFSTLRFSFSKYNTINQIDFCIEKLKNKIPILRKYFNN